MVCRILKTFVVSILIGANAMALLLLWVCCAITWIDSSVCPRLAVVCIAFPFILLFNFLFIIFWLLFKPRLVAVPVVGTLVCAGFALDYFPLHLQAQRPDDAEADLTVLSWNVKDFGYRTDSVVGRMEAYVDSLSPDIICMQECAASKNARDFRQHLSDKGYEWSEQKGRTIFTRFPIIDEETLEAETALRNGVNVYTLFMDGDTLVVMNTHFESNFISPEDRHEGKASLVSRNKAEIRQEGAHIWKKLAASQRRRGMQVDTLVVAIDGRYKGKSLIVCGDFNDTPISYPYQLLSRRLQSAYRNRGFGLGISYNERYFPFRIDHLFHTSDWQTITAHVDKGTLLSDHYPLIVKLRKR